MLASYRFSRSTLNNQGESRTYRRETWLFERVMRRPGQICSHCYAEIQTGETYAVTESFTRLCRNCYGDLPNALALATVTVKGVLCVTVQYSTYQGVAIHNFTDCAILVGEDGSLYRFANLREAQGFIEATLAICAAPVVQLDEVPA